ncbi:MAG: SDR family NAD(P)-dependent oxidoreductase, partial [Planctomycetota bacterium]
MCKGGPLASGSSGSRPSPRPREAPPGKDFPARYGPWALVTGASSGLGRAFAAALGGRGLNLLLVARRGDRLGELAAGLAAASRGGHPEGGPRGAPGFEALPVPLDLTAPDALPRLREAAGEREIGLLVSNAGFGYCGGFAEQDPERVREMVRLNCEVPALLARAFLPPMRARGRGGMILVASTAAYQATPWMALYGATKGFDLLLGEALGAEFAPRGVDVLTVSPGHTDTEF